MPKLWKGRLTFELLELEGAATDLDSPEFIRGRKMFVGVDPNKPFSYTGWIKHSVLTWGSWQLNIFQEVGEV